MTPRQVRPSGVRGERGAVLIDGRACPSGTARALGLRLRLRRHVVEPPAGAEFGRRRRSGGALSLAFDSPTDQAAARARAIAMATENQVWAQAPSVTDGDVTFPVCPPGTPGPTDTCVKVDVFRNQARGNALPTFFAHLVDITSQGVVATATAQVVPVPPPTACGPGRSLTVGRNSARRVPCRRRSQPSIAIRPARAAIRRRRTTSTFRPTTAAAPATSCQPTTAGGSRSRSARRAATRFRRAGSGR